jgi:glutamyl-Q tRNA(Asp) synthetase
MGYTGRFAPSPTGPLHMGSLMTAVASYCQTKLHNGKWLLRIEDIDPPRELPGATQSIISTLDKLGFEWDGDILYQSERSELYRHAIEHLQQQELVYPCLCSRKKIAATGVATRFGVRYAGDCRNRRDSGGKAHSLRIKVPSKIIQIDDLIQPLRQQNLWEDTGDFIIKRADGQYAYQLAVVVDDADQQITEVVRGSDLLDSTARQIYLLHCLEYAVPDYAHIPVLVDQQGDKLSKQSYAAAIDVKTGSQALWKALWYLNQQPPADLRQDSIREIWQWSLRNWDLSKIPTMLTIKQSSRSSYA